MIVKPVSWIAGIAMLCCAALASAWHPVAVANPGFQLEALIPAQFGAWRVDAGVIPVAPRPTCSRTWTSSMARSSRGPM